MFLVALTWPPPASLQGVYDVRQREELDMAKHMQEIQLLQSWRWAVSTLTEDFERLVPEQQALQERAAGGRQDGEGGPVSNDPQLDSQHERLDAVVGGASAGARCESGWLRRWGFALWRGS